MRLKLHLLTIVFFTCCISAGLKAQSKLGFGAAILNKDTFNVGQTLRIQAYVHNFDTVAYNDVLSFGLKINGRQNISQVLFPNPFYDQVVNIPAGDSIFASLTVAINTAYFEIGPDILVVWPIAHDGSPQITSIDTTIIVRDKGVGINDIPFDGEVRTYYINKNIYLVKNDAEINFNRVRIFDALGRCIINQPTDGSAPVPFDIEPVGMYLVEITYNNDQTVVCKIIK